MIRLDSLDVVMDTGPLPPVTYDRLRCTETPDRETGEVRSTYTANVQHTGLHGFNGVLATDTSVSLRLSAKAMGNAYSDGISNATLPELCDRLNGTGLVTVTPDDLRAGRVVRADPFADCVTDDLPGFAETLRLIGRTSGDTTRTKGRGERVTLYHKLPANLGQLKTYAKGSELSMATHREFCELYPAAAAAVDGRHRAELTTQTRRGFRHIASMATGVVTLADLLDSPRTPVSDALDALLDTWEGRRRAIHSLPSLPDNLDAMLAQPTASPSADANALLATLYADLCHGDYEACKAAVRGRYGVKNAGRLYPALRAACEAYRSHTDSQTVHAFAFDTFGEYVDRVRDREVSDDR